MIISAVRPCRFSSTGPLLLAAGMLLAGGDAAQAQLNPQELLKQVLPGATSDSNGSAASGERACQRYAEMQGLDVRRISDTSRSGSNNLEVLLSVEDRDDRYDARCIYDTTDEEVRTARAASGWHTGRRRPARSWPWIVTSMMSTLTKPGHAATKRSRSTCARGCGANARTSPACTMTTSAMPCSPSSPILRLTAPGVIDQRE